MGLGRDLGLFLLRAGVGGALAAHGAQKLFGSFGGGGIEGTAGFLDSAGFAPGRRSAWLAGLCEFGGGSALALGLAAGPAGAAVAGQMAVASSVHWPKFFAMEGGLELPATFGLVGATVAIGGPGRLSLDALTGDALNKPWMRVVGLVSAAAGAALVIGQRKQTLAERAGAGQPSDPEAALQAEDPDLGGA